ncbi:helix-turn-helix domain-containing protein [Thermococcus sp. 2319x1]|uniref:helix-turn-helix transcriptional regulator n=1 Tax=Thermococcus sp. 2319x1 TaxID=1674923 RepID=UPI001584214C|nr:helix-turn-helix domain-containing protein [Thermococcus sp. 2319x1]
MKRAFALISILILLPVVGAQFTVSEVELTIYTDGYVKVHYQLIPDEYTSQIGLPLLGKNYEGVEVVDENGNPLNFEVYNESLIIYVENAQVVDVSYYTPDLTHKEGLVWTINVSMEYPFDVILPENAVVVDLSELPLKIASNVITMPPGNQSISYTLEFAAEGKEGGYLPIVAFLMLSAIVVLGFVAIKRRKRETPKEELHIDREEFLKKLERFNLNEDEKRALLYILEKGGRASQAEVRTALGIPKTTAWRMFKRLERQGLVGIIKGRKENWVELKP